MHQESLTVELVATITALLLIAAGVLALTKRIKLPFTVALVLVGIALREAVEHGPPPSGRSLNTKSRRM
jgi:CPA1 family monovalent cation:H+ antiporter